MRLPRIRLPRVRVTVRALLAVIAISALAMMGVRSNRYRLEAEDHAVLEIRCRNMMNDHIAILNEYQYSIDVLLRNVDEQTKNSDKFYRENYTEMKIPPEEIEQKLTEYRADQKKHRDHFVEQAKPTMIMNKRVIAMDKAFIEWHRALKKKYRRAMWLPWLPVPPDSPPPE